MICVESTRVLFGRCRHMCNKLFFITVAVTVLYFVGHKHLTSVKVVDANILKSMRAYFYSNAATQTKAPMSFAKEDLIRDFPLNIEGNDVIVFLHIQKTSGNNFIRHLVAHLDVKPPCRCVKSISCKCFNKKRQYWVFGSYALNWACGVHADWTENHSCVDDKLNRLEQNVRRRRYLYVTVLREPFIRYISEWKHTRQGGMWRDARHICNGRRATRKELPFCFNDGWRNITLERYISCPYNLANNRMTRMFANLSLVGCYNQSTMSSTQRNAILLRSAKENLRQMAFVGITEYQQEMQYMFERTFHTKFIVNFTQSSKLRSTNANLIDVTTKQRERILQLNQLDIELYRYAKDLFLQRLHRMHSDDRIQNNKRKQRRPWNDSEGPEIK